MENLRTNIHRYTQV